MCQYDDHDLTSALQCWLGTVPHAIQHYNTLEDHLYRLNLDNAWNANAIWQLARPANAPGDRPTGGMSFQLQFAGGVGAFAPALVACQPQLLPLIQQWRNNPIAANRNLLDQCIAILSGVQVNGNAFGNVRASKILFFAVADAPFYILDNVAWRAWQWVHECCEEIGVGPPPPQRDYAAWSVFCEAVVAHQLPLAANYLAQFDFQNHPAPANWNNIRADWVMLRVVDFMLWRIGNAIADGKPPPCPDAEAAGQRTQDILSYLRSVGGCQVFSLRDVGRRGRVIGAVKVTARETTCVIVDHETGASYKGFRDAERTIRARNDLLPRDDNPLSAFFPDPSLGDILGPAADAMSVTAPPAVPPAPAAATAQPAPAAGPLNGPPAPVAGAPQPAPGAGPLNLQFQMLLHAYPGFKQLIAQVLNGNPNWRNLQYGETLLGDGVRFRLRNLGGDHVNLEIALRNAFVRCRLYCPAGWLPVYNAYLDGVRVNCANGAAGQFTVDAAIGPAGDPYPGFNVEINGGGLNNAIQVLQFVLQHM